MGNEDKSTIGNWSIGSGVSTERRDFLAGAAGALGLTGTGAGNAFDGGEGAGRSEGNEPVDGIRHTHGGGVLGGDERVASIAAERVNDVEYVDVAAGAGAVQEAVDTADRDGANGVVVHGDVGEWTETVRLPDGATLEFLDGVSVTVSASSAELDTWTVGGQEYGTILTNADHDGGNRDITVWGGRFDFDGVDDNSVGWAPVWLHACEDSLFDSITVENVVPGREDPSHYGTTFSDCTDSVMRECVGRNVGYDPIAIKGNCERIEVRHCEAYDAGGAGIQASSIGPGYGSPVDVTFLNCETDEALAVHGYEEWGGARGIRIRGCTARQLSLIGQVENARVAECDVDSLALSALHETIRDVRVSGVGFSDRGSDRSTAVRLLGADGCRIENVTITDCRAKGPSLRSFVEFDAPDVAYLDVHGSFCDTDGAEGSAFLYSEEGSRPTRLRVHSCKVWNADAVLSGPMEEVRVRDTELRDVGGMDDGSAAAVETRANDRW